MNFPDLCSTFLRPFSSHPPGRNLPPHPSTLTHTLTITPITSKGSAELDVAVRQVQDRLGKAGSLDDTPDLDGAFALDQFPDNPQELRRELDIMEISPDPKTSLDPQKT